MADGSVVLIVLAAALLHASWNALLKSSGDRFNTYVAMDLSNFVVAGIAVAFVAAPAPESWPYIAASAFTHVFYRLFLLKAYRYGDLSRSYPIARGSAPLLVALASLAIGESTLNPMVMAGVLLISGGVMSLAFTRAYGVRAFDRGVAYALATGVVISMYSVIDAIGVRQSGSPLGYILWLFVVDCVVLPVYAVATQRGGAWPALRQAGLRGTLAGLLSMLGYGVVIWSFTRGGMAEIVALRETSVLFAALIGAIFLNEGFGPRRAVSAAVVAAGIILIDLAGRG